MCFRGEGLEERKGYISGEASEGRVRDKMTGETAKVAYSPVTAK